MMFARSLRFAQGLLVAVGLLALLTPSFLSAASIITVTNSGDVVRTEGEGTFQVTFTVKNNSAVDSYVLDFALATITPIGPDFDDTTFFDGVGGGNGLASAPIALAPGASGDFIYNLIAPDDGNPDDDFGLNLVEFFVEMSKLPAGVIPPPDKLSSVNNFLLFIDLTTVGSNPKPAELAALLPPNFTPPTKPDTLYNNPTDNPPGTAVLGDPYPSTLLVDVLDTPEPGALTIWGLGGMAIFGCAWRRRRRTAAIAR